MLPQCSHITRKRGIYTYRRRLPQPHAGEITLSLGTTSFWLARAMVEALDYAFDYFFARPNMDEFDIEKALRSYLREQINQLRQAHLSTPFGKPVHATEVSYPYDMRMVRDADLSAIDWQLRRLRKNLRERNIEVVAATVDELTTKPEGKTLADELAAHALAEERVTYPAALLIGLYVKEKTAHCPE